MFHFIMIVCLCIILVFMVKSQHFVKCAVLSALQGVISLFAVNFIGEFTGLHISLNWFSAAVGAVGGMPGVVFLVVTDLISKI